MEDSGKRRVDADDLRHQVDLWTGFVLANILWAVLAAAIVTLPLATAGLFAVMSERVRGRQPETLHVFVSGVRQRWRNALLVGVLDVLAGGFIVFNLGILGRIGLTDPLAVPSGALTLFCGIVMLGMNVYAWPLLVLEDLRPRRLLEMSLRFALGYPLSTFGILLAAAVPVAVSLVLPRGVFVLFTASCVAYIVAWGSWRVIRRHLTAEELHEYTAQI